MSSSDRPTKPAPALPNDPLAGADGAAAEIWDLARRALEEGDAARFSDEAVRQLMTAAIKLYVAKSDGEECTFRPLLGAKDEHVTATEAISATSEVLRALRLGPMELSLWYRRRPDEEH